jgi:hypothetical protein
MGAVMTTTADPRHEAQAEKDLRAPDDLPFLESISWFDCRYRDLSPLDMLRRYESGWRYLHALAEPSAEEWRFIRRLVERYGSTLDVPA